MSLFDVMKNGKNSMKAYQYAVKASTANMGNLETTGYKGINYSFETVFNQVLSGGARADASSGVGGVNPVQLGSGSALSGINVNFEQGEIVESGKLSAAILGTGLFIVSDDGGKSFLYTRAGEFMTDNAGNIADSQGRVLYGYKLDEDGNALSSNLVPIKSDGNPDVGWDYMGNSGVLKTNYFATKQAADAGEPLPDSKALYQIAITSFPNPSGLLQYDGTSFKETPSSGTAMVSKASGSDYGIVYSQSREKSNVFYIGEMLDALEVQRAMSASLTAIKIANQQIQNIIQQLGT